MRQDTTATLHTCDGCNTSHIQLAGHDMPNGFYVQVYEIHDGGSAGGDLYVCGERCLLKAFRRRTDVWTPNTDQE